MNGTDGTDGTARFAGLRWLVGLLLIVLLIVVLLHCVVGALDHYGEIQPADVTDVLRADGGTEGQSSRV
jgi:hypothetical protein